jgi:hypothetical protein
MTNGLAQALQGNFASLTRTGFVLDETTKNLIKNGTEAERAAALVTVLNSTYKDFNQNLRDTPMGQFQVLANSAETAKTIIGTDLLAAMQLISGPEGIGGAATAMEELATQIGNVIYGIGVLTSKIKNIPLLTPIVLTIRDVISAGPLGGLARLGENAKARAAGTPAQSPGQRMAIDKANKDALKLQKSKNTLSKIDNDNTTRKLVLTGDQLALQELEKKFDVERIGLFAALNSATDEETKMRLRSLIAIKDQDAALAGQIKATLTAATAMEDFGKAAYGVLQSFLNFGQFAIGERDTLREMGIGVVPENPGGINPPNYGALDTPLNAGSFAIGERDTLRAMGIGVVNVNVQGSVTTERDLVNAITQGIYNNQASGIPINYSTSYV